MPWGRAGAQPEDGRTEGSLAALPCLVSALNGKLGKKVQRREKEQGFAGEATPSPSISRLGVESEFQMSLLFQGQLQEPGITAAVPRDRLE